VLPLTFTFKAACDDRSHWERSDAGVCHRNGLAGADPAGDRFECQAGLAQREGVTEPPDAAHVSFTTSVVSLAASSVMMMAPLSTAAVGITATLTVQLPVLAAGGLIKHVPVLVSVKPLLGVIVLTVTAVDEAGGAGIYAALAVKRMGSLRGDEQQVLVSYLPRNSEGENNPRT